MARTRSIKPAFFKNEILSLLPLRDQLTFIGLWMLADREGRLQDRPMRIKGELFPYTEVDIEGCLSRLHQTEFIIRYQIGENRYIAIPNFGKHQSPHKKEVASTIPGPVLTNLLINNGVDQGQPFPVPAAPSTLPPVVPSTLPPSNARHGRSTVNDEQWGQFRTAYEATGKPLIEEDFVVAQVGWVRLDTEQRALAIAGIAERVSAGQWSDPQFILKPDRYLAGEYRRKVLPRSNGVGSRPMSRQERINKATEEA